MRRPKKCTVLIFVGLLLIVGIVLVVWEINDWPPIRLILKYGFPPTGGPTGNKRVIEGIEFVELKPGYVFIECHTICSRGDLLGRIASRVGLSLGERPRHVGRRCGNWDEVEEPTWISSGRIDDEIKLPGRCRWATWTEAAYLQSTVNGAAPAFGISFDESRSDFMYGVNRIVWILPEDE